MTSVSNSYANWHPKTHDTLDLRLAPKEEGKDDGLLMTMSRKMKGNLKALYTQASFVTEHGCASLVRHCPNVEIVVLNCARKTGNAALKALSNLSELRELNVNRTIVESPLNHLFQERERITDSGVFHILTNCQKIEKLDLSESDITDRTLQLAEKTKTLKVLKIEDCYKLTPAGITTLAEKRPDLKIIQDFDDTTNATLSFFELIEGVKDRYLPANEWEMVDENGSALFKPEIPEEEAMLISPELLAGWISVQNP